MRQLKTSDLFAALRVLKAVGIKDEVVELASSLQGKKTGKTQEQIGTELILGILANCGEKGAESAFYEFLAGPTEKDPAELKEMELTDFANLVKDMIASIDFEVWKGYFRSLASIVKNS